MASMTEQAGMSLIILKTPKKTSFCHDRLTSEWLLSTHTADERWAGTDSGIQLVIHGVYGDVSQNLKGGMEQGYVDSWDVEYDIGDPYSIEIEKDSEGWHEGWKLWEVNV